MEKLYFVATDECNLKCDFCYVYKGKKNIKKGNLELLEKTLKDERVEILYLIGGEPTKEFEYLVSIINSVYKRCDKIYIITNGTLLNDYYLEKLLYYDNVYLQVTCYKGYYPQHSHDRILYHLLLNDETVIEDFIKLNGYNYWFSVDRFIQRDLSSVVYNALEGNFLTINNLRHPNNVGKDCSHFRNQIKIISGNEITNNCYGRHCLNDYKKIEKSIKCEECKNLYCDACICDDMIGDNREMVCNIYDVINIYLRGKNGNRK